jgi:hypothetical protein
VPIVADLLVPRWVATVRVPPGNFFKHLHKVHVYPGIALDELLEFLEGGGELLLGVRRDVVVYVGEILAVDAVVGRQPCSRPSVGRQVSYHECLTPMNMHHSGAHLLTYLLI